MSETDLVMFICTQGHVTERYHSPRPNTCHAYRSNYASVCGGPFRRMRAEEEAAFLLGGVPAVQPNGK